MSNGAAMTESTCGTVASLIRNIRAGLAAAGIESNEQEAVWLIEFVLGFSAVTQLIDHDRPLSSSEVARVQTLVARRTARGIEIKCRRCKRITLIPFDDVVDHAE